MDFKKLVKDNSLKIVVGLLAVNFVIISWGAVNWGIYGTRNSTSLFKLDTSKNKQLLMETEDTDGIRTPNSVGQTDVTVNSANLTLTCSDDDFASAFAAIRPAVVNITADKVTSTSTAQRTSGVTFDDPAIQFIEEQSLGSGIIVDPRGYIVTNAHVVSSARGIKVITFSYARTAYTAEVIKKDTINDIAILKINPTQALPTAVLGDSGMIKVAESVMAVGSPFGLEHSVTAGIISDDSRNLVIDGQTYNDMIQTDAAINRGNSGGPLVNLKGEVIGINTAIYAPTGVFTGIGFAIPINRIKPMIKEVVATGSI
ncbi:MAG: trypsin-like peptidase domain-containing protein [Candidatus Omnitrophica bacterium]|nr:trypsin-like peptidase domain-containing protein [Candidatus Omnitrophota bacterium]